MAFKDIRKSRKWLSAEEIRIVAAFLILLSAVLALNVYVSRSLPGGEWLLVRWNGIRTYLGLQADASDGLKAWRSMPDGEATIHLDQPELYGAEVARRAQQIVYGRDAFANEYRYILNDPFYIVLLYIPLAFFPDFSIVRGLWMLFAEAALLMSVLFSFRLSEWSPPRGLSVLLVGFGLFSFFSLNALVTASTAIFLNFLYLGVLLALRSFSDELAGGLLFLAAYQWEVGGLFFLFVIIFVIANRRWGVVAGFGMSLVVMLIVSFLVNPGWGLPYFRAVLSNLIQGARLNLGQILAAWFPEIRFQIGAAVSILLVAVVFIESLRAVDASFRRVVWTASLSLAAMPLTGLAIFPANYVVLLLPLVLVISLIWERWLRWRLIMVILVFLVAFLVPFAFYIQTVWEYSPFYNELLYVLPPLATILALYWMRWWVVHSPRVWADGIGNRR